MNLENVFRAINKKMILDFQEISSEIEHRGSKGKVREIEIVYEYLSKYVPGNIGIANGEIISTNDQVSNEIDIILFEKNSTPYLLKKEGYQIFPIECVYSVIEVKSFLDKSQIEDSFKKILKVKNMPKLSFEPQKGPIITHTNLYDSEWQFFPTVGFVIAYDSIDLKTLNQHLEDLNNIHPIEKRIDSVWVLNKGMIVNFNTENEMIELAPNSKTITRPIMSENPLMLLTIQLQSILLSGFMPHFNLKSYLKNANYGQLYK